MRSFETVVVEFLGNHTQGEGEPEGLPSKKLVKLMDMGKLNKIAYNCRKATLLIEKQHLARLTVKEAIELNLHLAGCSVCRIFQQQSVVINKMIKELVDPKSIRTGLDSDFKKSLQEQINDKL